MANKISVVLDFVTDKAVSSVKGFRQSIDDADGAVGKMKAGASSAFDSIKANAGVAALAAGSALVAFGAKGVAAFNDLAIEADKLRNVSGLSLEEASKWIAVGDDIGVSAQTMEKSFGKFNVELGKGGKALEEFGIGVVKAKDGTVDANATFLNAIDTIKGIEDPTKKAQAAQAAFGKGWQDMAELINIGSADIVTAFGEVSEAQIIDEGEIAKAKKYRESMDKLQDSVKDHAMNLGEDLTPAISTVADVLSTVAPAIGKVVGVVGDAFVEMSDAAYAFGAGVADVVDALPFVDLAETIGPTLHEWEKLEQGTADLVAEFSKGNPTIQEFDKNIRASGVSMEAANLAVIEYAKQTKEAALETLAADGATRLYIDGQGVLQGQLEDTTDDTDDLTHANDLLADKIAETTDRYKDLKGELSAEEAFHNAEAMWADLQQSAVDAYTAASTGADDAKQKAFDHAGAVIEAKNKVVELGEQYADLPEEEVTRIVALIDEGKLAEAEAAFNTLTRNRTMQVSITASGGTGNFKIVNTGGGQVNFDTGGTVPGPLGQPRLAIVHGGEEVLTASEASAARNATSGGSVFAITVNAGMGADGRRVGDAVVDAIKDFERRNGNAWRS